MKVVDTLYRIIERGREGKNIGLPTGINKMDQWTGGIQKKIYTLIFGLSGSGKTSWVLYSNIYRPLRDNPDKNIKVVYYSLEMSAEILMAKLLCLYIYEEFGRLIPYTALLSWQEILDEERYDYVLKAKNWLNSIQDKLIIFDKSLNSKIFYATFKTLLEEWGSFEKSEDGKREIYIKKNPDQIVLCVMDHLGCCIPQQGRSKKEEIDEISMYAVRFREKCESSFYMLMQENRNSSDMDRRKADLSEPSAEDIKDSGNPYNDCDICIAIYNPLKHKIKNYRGYQIIADNPSAAFQGIRDRFRSAILIKNRYGINDKMVGLNFFGEIGLFKELPKGNDILDYSKYLTLSNSEDINFIDEVKVQKEQSQNNISYKM